MRRLLSLVLVAVAFTAIGLLIGHRIPRPAPSEPPDYIEIVRPPVPPPLKVRLRVVGVRSDGEYRQVAYSDDSALWQVVAVTGDRKTVLYAQPVE